MNSGFFSVERQAVGDHLGGQRGMHLVKLFVSPGTDQGQNAQGQEKHENGNSNFEGGPGAHGYWILA